MSLFTRKEGSPIYTPDTKEIAAIRRGVNDQILSGKGRRTPFWARIIQDSFAFHPNPDILEEWLLSIHQEPVSVVDSSCDDSTARVSADYLDLSQNKLGQRILFATYAGQSDIPYTRTYALDLTLGNIPVARISRKDPTGQTQPSPYTIVPSRSHLELTAELVRTALPLSA